MTTITVAVDAVAVVTVAAAVAAVPLLLFLLLLLLTLPLLMFLEDNLHIADMAISVLFQKQQLFANRLGRTVILPLQCPTCFSFSHQNKTAITINKNKFALFVAVVVAVINGWLVEGGGHAQHQHMTWAALNHKP